MLTLCLVHVTVSQAQVITYEGNVFPETCGWERDLGGTPGADRQIVDGGLVLTADLPEGWPGPTGDADFYRRPISEFVGSPAFFLEWRVVTDVPARVLDDWAVPVAAVGGGQGAAFYHTTITDARARFLRSLTLPIVFVEIDPETEHTYRVELRGSKSYAWYIDGTVAAAGTPEGAYPDETSSFVWGAGRSYFDSVTRWDFIRFGVIPEDGSGDYDSDGLMTAFDFYFIQECLTNERLGINGGPGRESGPGCRFADFDADGDVDLLDLAVFSRHFTGAAD